LDLTFLLIAAAQGGRRGIDRSDTYNQSQRWLRLGFAGQRCFLRSRGTECGSANFGVLLALVQCPKSDNACFGSWAAAGLAAGFNVPIVFFALEVVLGTTFYFSG